MFFDTLYDEYLIHEGCIQRNIIEKQTWRTAILVAEIRE